MCPQRPEEGIGSHRTEVTDGSEPRGCWESNLSSLQGQMLLTTEPSLHPRINFKPEMSVG